MTILVTGAGGQIGSELVEELSKNNEVIASDYRDLDKKKYARIETADVRDKERLEDIIRKNNITEVYHLAGILSAVGEKNPEKAWDININGLKNVLELSRKYGFKVFWPSSIAVFGSKTPKKETKQDTIITPETMYGITKRTGELLCNYYNKKYGVDVRSLRYPGLISYKTMPGGGTTDYAVDIFFKALDGNYVFFVEKGTRLPMMYMPDAIRGTIELMNADSKKITVRESYNFAAMSFSTEELAREINEHINFKWSYNPDYRNKIAKTWPESIDDSKARQDWNWKERYHLKEMVEDMFSHIHKITYLMK